jgi:hypothetical protein
MAIASAVSILAFFGLFGEYAEAFSTFIACALSLVLCPGGSPGSPRGVTALPGRTR